MWHKRPVAWFCGCSWSKIVVTAAVFLWASPAFLGVYAVADESASNVESDTIGTSDRPVPVADAADHSEDGLVDASPDESAQDDFVGPPYPDPLKVAETPDNNKKPPVAVNIDLSLPIAVVPEKRLIDIGTVVPPTEPPLMEYAQPSLFLLGAEVTPSTSARLSWSPDNSFAGIAAPTPVLVVNGAKTGPTLCVTAAIHGDELNGIEIVRRVLYDLDPEKLSGAVIGVPIVNLQGFRRASRYLPDRRDLNRYFPGNPTGSSASRLANSFFNEVIAKCDALVDVHTGSFHRTNLPQLRADLKNPQVLELTQGFGSTVVLHSSGTAGTLRRAAAEAGIPSVTLEAGEPARLQEDAVDHGTKGVNTLLNELNMYKKVTRWGHREPIYYRSKWERADRGGVLFSKVELGDRVNKDQLLGTVTDPITNVQTEIKASQKGRILGMALNQFVMPGFAAFRIGIETDDEHAVEPEEDGVSERSADSDVDEHLDDSLSIVDANAEQEDVDARDYLEDSE